MPLLSLSSDQATANLRRAPLARWPQRAREQGRLSGVASVGFQPGFQLEPGEAIFTVGSCFARNIEARLAALGFELPTLGVELAAEERGETGVANSLLNKYTPFAILNEVRWALDPGAAFPEAGFVEAGDGLWCDPHAFAEIAPAPLERVRERRAMVGRLYGELKRCRVVVMTLGLVEAWFDTATDLYLNGPPPAAACRREPERFELRLLSVEEVGQALEEIHALLSRHGHPGFRMLLTVSPVPLSATFRGGDVISANAYSKSALRAAAEAFVLAHPEADYFPSYEMVTHSERAATFADDCRHVSRPVVAAIVDRMVRVYAAGLAGASAGGGEAAPAAAGPEAAPPADVRQQVAEALRRKELARAEAALHGLDGGRWAEAGYGEFEFRLEYGRVLMHLGRELEAEPHLIAAHELEPESTAALLGLSRLHRKLERRREAEACLARAVELSPDNAQFRFLLASDMARDGRHAQAVPQLIRCLALKPDYPGARPLLDDCERRLAGDWAETEAETPAATSPRPTGGGLTALLRRLVAGAADDG